VSLYALEFRIIRDDLIEKSETGKKFDSVNVERLFPPTLAKL